MTPPPPPEKYSFADDEFEIVEIPLGNQLFGDVLGIFARDIRPNFRKIGFGRVG
jgi:hypothetical protein